MLVAAGAELAQFLPHRIVAAFGEGVVSAKTFGADQKNFLTSHSLSYLSAPTSVLGQRMLVKRRTRLVHTLRWKAPSYGVAPPARTAPSWLPNFLSDNRLQHRSNGKDIRTFGSKELGKPKGFVKALCPFFSIYQHKGDPRVYGGLDNPNKGTFHKG